MPGAVAPVLVTFCYLPYRVWFTSLHFQLEDGAETLRPPPAVSAVDLLYPLPGDPRGDLCAANLTRRRLENQCIPREFEEAFLLRPDVIRK